MVISRQVVPYSFTIFASTCILLSSLIVYISYQGFFEPLAAIFALSGLASGVFAYIRFPTPKFRRIHATTVALALGAGIIATVSPFVIGKALGLLLSITGFPSQD
jgi:hypothetical protein